MKLIMENWRRFLQEKFTYKGSEDYFRVELPDVGYAEGRQHLRFKECQSDVDALMSTPEYAAAKEKYEANNTTKDMAQDENGKYYMKEVPAKFRPRFYDVENAWITNPEMRGKGHGKELYIAFIEKATEYSKNYGGVFVGAHHCTIGSGTSEDARRVWASITKDYTSSGDVVFIGLQDMKNLMENWRRYLSENKALSKAELEALQKVKDGLKSETHAAKALVLSRLVDKGLIDGEVEQGQSYKKTKRGHDPVGYRTIKNISITPEGESALSAGLQKSADDSSKHKKVIMQAVIDAGGSPLPEDKLPGYNPKTFKLKGKYREAFDELRGFGSDINALSTENTKQGRVVSPGPDFEKVKGELGL